MVAQKGLSGSLSEFLHVNFCKVTTYDVKTGVTFSKRAIACSEDKPVCTVTRLRIILKAALHTHPSSRSRVRVRFGIFYQASSRSWAEFICRCCSLTSADDCREPLSYRSDPVASTPYATFVSGQK